MKRTLKILHLRWQRWWACLAVEIDEAQIATHLPSLERNRKRLQNIEFELDQLYMPQSIIMRAISRTRR